MYRLAVFACAVVAIHAHGNTMMNNMPMNNMPMNNMAGINYMNNLGSNNMGMNNNVMQMLAQVIGNGGMGGGNGGRNGGGGGGGGSGGSGSMMSMFMGMLMSNILNNNNMNNNGNNNHNNNNNQNNNNYNNNNNNMGMDGMREMDNMVRQKMMMEMAEMMMQYMDFMGKQGEFEQAMRYLCVAVHVTYEMAKEGNYTLFNETTDASAEKLYKESEGGSDEDLGKAMVNLMTTNVNEFQEMFLRISKWACDSGDAYMKAYHKMEKMEEAHEGCDKK